VGGRQCCITICDVSISRRNCRIPQIPASVSDQFRCSGISSNSTGGAGYASRAARLGLPLPVAKQLLGHTKIENTARYTHFDDTHLFEIADFISGLIDAAMLGREVGR
jgi:hypothetical protein